jgi:energy-coupling factor transporter ATP-binding protein EcfA2
MATNNELVFIVGEETRPRIEKDTELGDSFFQDVYTKTFSLVEKMLVDFEKRKNETIGDYYQESRNNIIAFVGERGSGKTSCLQSVYQYLANNKTSQIEHVGKGFLSLPTIDPSYFDVKSNILEVIIANMFLNFKIQAKRDPGLYQGDENASILEKKRKLVEKFQNVKNSLDGIKRKDTKVSNDSIEELSQLASGIGLKKQMNELIQCYLDYFGRETLIIAIDDMDLQTKHAFEMVEQIRKYLIIPNIIIFAGVKLTQLKDVIKQNYYKEYALLIAKGQFSESIENIVERYIAKLLPIDQQLHLPELSDNLDRQVCIKKEGSNTNVSFNTIDEAVLHLIFQKTRYMFYNSNADKNLIIPNNLRDLWGLLSFLLNSMKDLSSENNEAVVYENRLKFRNYFLESWCYEHLDSEYYKFIQQIGEYDVSEVNKKIIDYLKNICDEHKIEYDKRLTFYYNKPYNTSLADVDYFLDRLSRIKKPIIDNFVFALRTIYSMLLYKTLENGKLQTKKRNELKKGDARLSRFSDYEKLLGGELMQIENPYCSTVDNQYQMKNLLHHHEVNSKKLEELSKFAFLGDIQTDFNGVTKNMALDICEFFLLTTYRTSTDAQYRSKRFCSYSFYIQEIFNGSRQIVYSSFAVLFTVCKFYYEYLYYVDKRTKKEDKFNWNLNWNNAKYWDIWEKLMDPKSLFFNILGYDDGVKRRNKKLEGTFIRNLDILDYLQDFLPYLSKLELTDEESNFPSIIRLYEKLSDFHFPIYPKLNGEGKQEITFEVYRKIADTLKEVEGDKYGKKIFMDIFMNRGNETNDNSTL